MVAGAAVGFLFDRAIGGLQLTGLDRVFDSLKKDIPHGDYAKQQGLMRELGAYAGGKASADLGVQSINVSGTASNVNLLSL